MYESEQNIIALYYTRARTRVSDRMILFCYFVQSIIILVFVIVYVPCTSAFTSF